ncbi:hypothetical protein [Pseudonocardia spinosispora]|uniref:hypothetical protein n=1 Tax=Pseudonocardia spinosispora TaxID=103441 RepID=UPI0004159187|nr:hypothetical protein [Pseudonocardia spinosispora]
MPPAARVPGIVVARRFVGQADDAVVMLLEIRAYSQGCLLDFVATARSVSPAERPRLDADLGDRVAGEYVVRRLDDPLTGAPRLWISPLPPVEGFTLVVEWPGFGIEQRTPVDGGPIRQAAWESFPALPA